MLTMISLLGRLQMSTMQELHPQLTHHLHSVTIVDNFDVVASGCKLAIVKVALLSMRYSQESCKCTNVQQQSASVTTRVRVCAAVTAASLGRRELTGVARDVDGALPGA
jgi:hypothetical protein